MREYEFDRVGNRFVPINLPCLLPAMNLFFPDRQITINCEHLSLILLKGINALRNWRVRMIDHAVEPVIDWKRQIVSAEFDEGGAQLLSMAQLCREPIGCKVVKLFP